MPRRRKSKNSFRVEHFDFKSGFEKTIGNDLIKKGIPFAYEAQSFKYTITIPRSVCPECGSSPSTLERTYTPDFFFQDGLIVEAKGRFTAEERKKHAAMKEQYPDMDLRLLFKSNNWLGKAPKRGEPIGKKKNYVTWCEAHGIQCAVGNVIPEEWL